MTFGFLVFAPVANRWHFLLNKVSFDALWKSTLSLSVFIVIERNHTDNPGMAVSDTANLEGAFADFRCRNSAVAARVIIDQSIFAPLATTLFIASQGVMDGTPAAGIRRRLEERIIPTWQKQVMLFGPAQTINFAFVPLQLRPPYMNVSHSFIVSGRCRRVELTGSVQGISIFWSCFLASTHTPSVEVALHADKIGEEDLAVLAVEIL